MRISLQAQVVLVSVLFVGALAALWTTGVSVVAREGRRETARARLDRAGQALADRGRSLLALAPRWPEYAGPKEWDDLDRRLAAEAAATLARFEAVEGGYYLRDPQRFLGSAFEPRLPEPKKGGPRHGPPPREAGLIEEQVDSAIRSRQPIFLVKAVPPGTVAIRTAPVMVDVHVIGATWTMIRLLDPLFLDRALRTYQLAAGLALGGVVLSLLLTFNLARTVRRHAAERARLQAEVRRSERLAALGQMLAGVAHELRNPLAGLLANVQLWQRGIGPDAESMGDVVGEANRLEAIIARLLQFSRAGVQDLAPGDLNAVVAEVARLARAQAEAQGVRVELALDPGLPPALLSAPTLVQVFRNLATNALHAMPHGGTLRFATRTHPSGKAIEASVEDTGPGLSAEVKAHLFEPFFTTKEDGTGLGLAIAREIVLAHQGELTAEPTQKGRGAAFRVVLPTTEQRH
ncbi:MAG: ATP-binding protein [Isosphaeraceae bacterium]|nr:ATP-binding protein [Isosphaeraceae bacterium]